VALRRLQGDFFILITFKIYTKIKIIPNDLELVEREMRDDSLSTCLIFIWGGFRTHPYKDN